MIDGLTPFSADFARALFEAFPWLREHARLDERPGIEPGSLLVEVTPEPVRELATLEVSTERAEVTIAFGSYHQHFGWPVDPPGSDDPLEFLADLFADRVRIEDLTRDGQWVGSTTLRPGEDLGLEGVPEGTVVHLRSWSGDGDEELRVDDDVPARPASSRPARDGARFVLAAGPDPRAGIVGPMAEALDPERDLADLVEALDAQERLRVELGARAHEVVAAISDWSPAQHLFHVALATDLALRNVEALVKGEGMLVRHDLEPSEIFGELRARGAFPRGETQSPRAVRAPETVDPGFLENEMAQNRAAAAALVGREAAIGAATARVRHQALGGLTAAEWLHFARLHARHHLGIAGELAGA